MSKDWSNFNKKGWCFLDSDIEYDQWVEATKVNIIKKFKKKEFNSSDFRSGYTWFAGINFLDNGSEGDINGASFSSKLWSEICCKFGHEVKYWDSAQVSICWKGYPKKDKSETENAFKYRLKKYSAHVDGLIPIGLKKRRFVKEFHAFILGIPIINNKFDSSPLVVWEGSHIIFRDLFRKIYTDLSQKEVNNYDITEIYQKYRRKVFSICPVRKIVSKKNQPYILDRHLLHGVFPWDKTVNVSSMIYQNDPFCLDPVCGRIVVYFRPSYKNSLDWVTQD